MKAPCWVAGVAVGGGGGGGWWWLKLMLLLTAAAAAGAAVPLPYPQSKTVYEEETGKTNFE